MSYNEDARDSLEDVGLDKDVTEDRCKEVWDLLEARDAAVVLGDIVRSMLSLPRPQEQDCRNWDFQAHQSLLKSNSLYRSAFTCAWSAILDTWPGTPRREDPFKKADSKYCRPTFYLAAAVATKFALIQGFYDIEKVKEFATVKVKDGKHYVHISISQCCL